MDRNLQKMLNDLNNKTNEGVATEISLFSQIDFQLNLPFQGHLQEMEEWGI